MLAGVAIVLLALNLRTFAGSLGVMLPQIRASLTISTTVAGVLTTVPVLVFALIGPFAPRLVTRFGLRGAAVGSLVVLSLALLGRSLVQTSGWFLVMTALATAGVAIGNVILPALVKQHFPDRIALWTPLATVFVVLGGAIGSTSTVYLAQSLGGWRGGLGWWGVAAALALLPWLVLASTRSRSTATLTAPTPRWRDALRSRLAWALVAVFAAQSMAAYVGFGWLPEVYQSVGISLAEAGVLLGVWSLLGVPMGLLVPGLLRRYGSSAWVPWLWALTSAAGWLGLAVADGQGVWLWTILLGVGSGAFPWVLSMIALHSGSVADTALLSGFVQSVGYLVAAAGPFGFGALRDLTGSWHTSMAIMAAVALMIGVAGTVVVRSPEYSEQSSTRAPGA